MGEPLQIGRMKVKNRIVFPPMNTNLTSEDGYVMPELEEYYLRRARGGAGMIVLEAATIDPNSRNHPGQPVFYDRKHVASWTRLVERIHRYDVRVSIELVHYGSEASIPPHKEMIGRLVTWYRSQMEALNIEVRLNTDVTEESLDELNPDVVFLAARAHYVRRIPGSSLPNVVNAFEALTNPSRAA